MDGTANLIDITSGEVGFEQAEAILRRMAATDSTTYAVVRFRIQLSRPPAYMVGVFALV